MKEVETGMPMWWWDYVEIPPLTDEERAHHVANREKARRELAEVTERNWREGLKTGVDRGGNSP